MSIAEIIKNTQFLIIPIFMIPRLLITSCKSIPQEYILCKFVDKILKAVNK